MDAASSCRPCASKIVRGCAGLGRMDDSGRKTTLPPCNAPDQHGAPPSRFFLYFTKTIERKRAKKRLDTRNCSGGTVWHKMWRTLWIMCISVDNCVDGGCAAVQKGRPPHKYRSCAAARRSVKYGLAGNAEIKYGKTRKDPRAFSSLCGRSVPAGQALASGSVRLR